ncbi:MAG: 3-phenylpropionate/cinnamic acid dioxygenase subunit beta [Dehalococcoidia bacterium]
MSHERIHSVEQFLYREARLLDDRRFRDWLPLLTDDISYTMPTRFNRLREGPNEQWEVEKELDELCFFEETKDSLSARVERFYSGMAWAEEPPSRTRHLITNVEVLDTGTEDEVLVYSSFLTYRSRLEGREDDENFFVGRREDTLRLVDGGWRLARRRIITDAIVMNAPNLSIFF